MSNRVEDWGDAEDDGNEPAAVSNLLRQSEI
jgi:hypothetical protein